MAQGKITAKQQEILTYIKECILKKGYPPAVREICEAVNLKSTSSVHSHLESLEANGYIRKDPTKPRAIEILDDEFALNRREVVQVPMIGTVAAGEPILAQEHIEDYFPIPAEMLPNKDTFMLKVKGESMQVFLMGTRSSLSRPILQKTGKSLLHSSTIPLLSNVFTRKTGITACSRRMTPWSRSSLTMWKSSARSSDFSV